MQKRKIFRDRIDNFVKKNFCYDVWQVGLIKMDGGSGGLVEGLTEGVCKFFANFSSENAGRKPHKKGEKFTWLPLGMEPGISSGISYIADPFIFYDSGKYYIFVERYTYYKKGTIDCYVLNKKLDVIELYKNIVPNSHHVSFPQVRSVNGKIVLTCERAKSGEFAIYSCVNFPDKWQKMQTNITDPLVDPVLFSAKKSWWVLASKYNLDERKGRKKTKSLRLQNRDLFLYKVEKWGDFSEGSVIECKKCNDGKPVLSSYETARNGGSVFEEGGALYRISQDCSAEYGAAVNLCKVTTVSSTTYSETLVSKVTPSKISSNATGIHTVNGANGLVCFDVKFSKFYLLKPIHKLIKSLP